MDNLSRIAKRAESLINNIAAKSAFVPAQPAPPPGAPAGPPPQGAPAGPPPQGAPAGPPPQGGAYPPELLQAAQEMGLPIGPDGMPMDPETGQPIPPEVLSEALNQGAAADPAPPPGAQGAAPQGAPVDPAAQGAEPMPTPEEVMEGMGDMADAIGQMSDEQTALKQQIADFQATVAEVNGKMKMLLQVVKTPAPGEAML